MNKLISKLMDEKNNKNNDKNNDKNNTKLGQLEFYKIPHDQSENDKNTSPHYVVLGMPVRVITLRSTIPLCPDDMGHEVDVVE